MKWIIAISSVFLLASCAEQKYEIGKYVYVDCFNTIHTNRECASVLTNNPKTKDERMANMQGVQFIDTCNLVNKTSWPYKFCPKCVDDDAFQNISSIMERNEKEAR